MAGSIASAAKMRVRRRGTTASIASGFDWISVSSCKCRVNERRCRDPLRFDQLHWLTLALLITVRMRCPS